MKRGRLVVASAALAATMTSTVFSQPSSSSDSQSEQVFFILLDTSASMRGERMQRLKEAFLKDFLPSLDKNTSRLHFFTFDRGLQIKDRRFNLSDPSQYDAAEAFVNGLRADGRETWAWRSLRDMLAIIRKSYAGALQGTARIFVYTDGLDNEPGPNNVRLEEALQEFKAIYEMKQERAGLRIYTLGLKFEPTVIDAIIRQPGTSVGEVPETQPIPSPAFADFFWWPERPTAGTSVKFINRSAPLSLRQKSMWDFGDGHRSQDSDPVHTFNVPKKYRVELIAGPERVVREIDVVPPDEKIRAAITVRPEAPVAGEPVYLVSQSSGPIRKHIWNLGNGRVIEGPSHVTVIYEEPKNYKVVLSVYGEHAEDRTETTITVSPPKPPTLQVRAYPLQAQVGQTVQFWLEGAQHEEKVSWSFGDSAQPRTGREVAVAFDKPGKVRAVARLPWRGRELSAEAEIEVQPLAPPVAQWIVRSQEPLYTGDRILLQDMSKGHILEWEWDFGDGRRSSETHPEVVYQRAADYTVTLVVKGPGGTNRASRVLSVKTPPPPIARFAVRAQRQTPVVGERVFFEDLSEGRIDSWQWDFGDGASSERRNPDHVYARAGTYTALLKVSGPGGDSVAEENLNVLSGFSVVFDVQPRQAELPFRRRAVTVRTTNMSSGEHLAFSWDFGDGSPPVPDFEPIHEYRRPDQYTIRLKARHQLTSEEIEAPPITIEIFPNRSIQRASFLSAAIAFPIILAWSIWFFAFRPPPLKRQYDLSQKPFSESSGVITIGSGWGSRGNRHEIPLPPVEGLSPDFAVLEACGPAPELQVVKITGNLAEVQGLENATDENGHPLSTRLSGAPNATTLSDGQFLQIGADAYRVHIHAEGVELRPLWKIRAGRTGINRLQVIRRNKPIDFETSSFSLPLLPDDEVLLGAYHFRVAGSRDGATILVAENIVPHHFRAALIGLSILAVASPWTLLLF